MSDKTQIPFQSVDADELPKQKGLTYSEVARIVGSLYLDTQMNLSALNEQHQSVSSEYHNQLEEAQSVIAELQKENQQLKDELEKQRG